MVDFHQLLTSMYQASGTIENTVNQFEDFLAAHPEITPAPNLLTSIDELKETREDLDRLLGESGYMPD